MKAMPVKDITNFDEIRNKPQEFPTTETPQIIDTESDSLMETQMVNESDRQMANFFDYVYNTCHEIEFPSLAWNYHKTESKDEIIFSEVKSGGDAAPIYQKQVVFSKNGEIKLFVYRKFCDFDIITPRNYIILFDDVLIEAHAPINNTSSPSKQKAADTFKKSKRVQLQALKRYKTKVEQLKCEMSNLQQQMQKMKSTKIYEVLKKYNISGAQTIKNIRDTGVPEKRKERWESTTSNSSKRVDRGFVEFALRGAR